MPELGHDRDVRICCDWFVVDVQASAALRAAQEAAEDARLAALPGAQRVEEVRSDRKRKVSRARGRGRASTTVEEFLVRWHGFDEADDTWEPPERFATWVGGARALAAYRASKGGAPAEASPALVYRQLKQPPEELTYYELVSRAEILKDAGIDDSDLDHAVVTLRPAHLEQVARVHAIALDAGSDTEE